jgi:hypothetical protein
VNDSVIGSHPSAQEIYKIRRDNNGTYEQLGTYEIFTARNSCSTLKKNHKMGTVTAEKKSPEKSPLAVQYLRVRTATDALAVPLSAEDRNVQSMPDASPTKWHLAHTTWFFENLVLADAEHKPFDDRYAYLFNSYYEKLGPRHSRPQRGLLTRPGSEEIRAYRDYVDDAMRAFCESLDAASETAARLTLGLHHEQQH